MRYIRTEDGFIIDTQNTRPFMIKNSMGHDYIDFNSGGMFKIKNMADAIEALCDCFVVYEKGGGFVGEHHTYNDLELAKYGANENVSIVYGAIWTDKGLIYVAKMDEKGKLELLKKEN